MTALQLAIYVFVFGSAPCTTTDAHYCHGTPVAYTQALPIGGRENGEDTVASTPSTRSEPAPTERCD